MDQGFASRISFFCSSFFLGWFWVLGVFRVLKGMVLGRNFGFRFSGVLALGRLGFDGFKGLQGTQNLVFGLCGHLFSLEGFRGLGV